MMDYSERNIIDESGMESFPASDPPSWTSTVGVSSYSTEADQAHYNYERFDADTYDIFSFSAPEIGDHLGDVFFYDLLSRHRSLEEFRGNKVVIETASVSCPMYASNVAAMNRLAELYANEEAKVCFILLYVRETMPGDRVHAHHTLHEKILAARGLRHAHDEKRSVFVDEVGGELHQRLGGFPNSCFIIDEKGDLIFRSAWNEPDQVKIVLSGLNLSREDYPADGLMAPDTPGFKATLRSLSSAGGHAWWDFCRNLFKMKKMQRQLDKKLCNRSRHF